MSCLTAFLEPPRHHTTATQDIICFDDRRASIECRILEIPSEDGESRGTSTTHSIQEPCRLAALIYINMAFRELPPRAAIHTSLTSRLRAALRQTDLTSCWGTLSETLLWVLFMGGAVALQEPIGPWFLSALTMVCTRLKLQSWHSVREVLLKYLWSDRIWGERCETLWLRVENEQRNCSFYPSLESALF